MDRVVEAELLDQLPPQNPEAVRSRRDLQRVNRIMGNPRLLARALIAACGGKVPQRLDELGAGDGTLLLEVARRLAPGWRNLTVGLVDQQALVRPETIAGFEALGWRAVPVKAEVGQWLQNGSEPLEAVVANLFLHHFSEAQLCDMFLSLAQRASVLVALEPRRATFPLWMSGWLWAVGCNRVTRHDAAVSVRAGFHGEELSRLWPEKNGWALQERMAGGFSHLFIARRLPQ